MGKNLLQLMIAAACAISTGAAAFPRDQHGLPVYSELPKEIRDTAGEVRGRCKEADVDGGEMRFDDWQGIYLVDLNGDGSDDIVVDHEHLCNGRMAGFNCSNRSCQFEVYKQVGKGKWRKVFDEYLHDKYIVAEGYRFQMLIAKIWAGDARCKPDPKEEYPSGRACNLFVTYKGGKWNWQKIR
jgi:hypothetical protein